MFRIAGSLAGVLALKTERRTAPETVGCEECILPPEMLRETINDSLQRRIVGEFELVLDDPRQ